MMPKKRTPLVTIDNLVPGIGDVQVKLPVHQGCERKRCRVYDKMICTCPVYGCTHDPHALHWHFKRVLQAQKLTKIFGIKR
jgi:hypothetical protein